MSGRGSDAWEAFKATENPLETLCAMIVDGKTLTEIAHTFDSGVSTLANWIASDPVRSAQAREARKAAASSYDDQALQVIRRAGDPFELAKAREEASHLRWRASKANPKEYGEKLDVTADVGIRSVSDAELEERAKRVLSIAGLSMSIVGINDGDALVSENSGLDKRDSSA